MKALTKIRYYLLIAGFVGAFFIPSKGQQLAFLANKNPDKDRLYEVNVEILDGSFININGKTNVNKFSCLNCDEITTYSKNPDVKQVGNSWYLDNAYIKVKSKSFDCGMKEMTKDFKDLLCVDSHPYMTIRIDKLVGINDINNCNALAKISLTIAGTTQKIDLPLIIKQENGQTICIGSTSLNIGAFNIQAPSKFFGLVKVEEVIDVDFNLLLDVSIDDTI